MRKEKEFAHPVVAVLTLSYYSEKDFLNETVLNFERDLVVYLSDGSTHAYKFPAVKNQPPAILFDDETVKRMHSSKLFASYTGGAHLVVKFQPLVVASEKQPEPHEND